MKKSLVIGSGVAGLAAAIRMAHRGHQVEVFELASRPGGKMDSFQIGLYRFDAGPSLFTMPQYVEELVQMLDGEKIDFDYHNLDVICNYFWNDGTRLSTYSDIQKTINEMSTVLGESKVELQKHFEQSKEKYELTGRTFLENSLHRAKTWFTKDVAKAMTKLHRLDLNTTMHKANASKFKNAKTVQLFDRYATYNGSNPYKAPGLLNIIPHFEYGFGAYLPKRGIYQIADTLYQVARKKGVTFHFDEPVQSITEHQGKVVGIQTNKGKYHGDIVITNMDAFYTYKKLLNDEKNANAILKQERSSSALIFYWGVNRKFPELDLHNILFADDYEQEFDLIAKGQISKDPTVYINITSKFIKSDAPAEGENWFVMINVPHHQSQNWNQVAEDIKPYILNKINKVLNVDLASTIEEEHLLTPELIQENTFSHTGSLYGTSSNSKFAAFLRHPNFSKQYENLYFCGGSVHPGGGIPLCLLSAKIVDELIAEKQ